MAETLFYRFKMRGGTFADLTSINEVPLDRELIVETDALRMKLGDGITNYNDLDYLGSGSTQTLYYREPMTNGNAASPSVLFSDGDIVFINQPTFAV